MNQTEKLVNRYMAVAWGTWFVWLGVLLAIPGDQAPLFVLGTGFIFLGMNLARRISNFPVHIFSVILGTLAFAAGGYSLLRPVLALPRFEIDILPLGLIVVGLYILIPGPKSEQRT